MAKNKQFTDKMRKATLITLSAGVGASAMIPGIAPAIEAHASEVAVPGLPAEGANFETDLGDVSNYNFVTSGTMYYYNGLQWINASLPNYHQDVREINGVLYATTKPYSGNSGKIHKYNELTRQWETIGSTANTIYDIVEAGDGNLVVGGGYYGTYGDYYNLYSSINGDSDWKEQMNAYHSKSNYGYNNTSAGLFRTGVQAEGVTYMFGESYNWTNIQTTTDGDNFAYKTQIYGNYHEAIYAGGKIVAVGEQKSISTYGSIAVGTPGGAFTVHKIGAYNTLNDVAYGNGKYVVVGRGMNGDARIYTSSDASTWTSVTPPAGTEELKGIAYDEANGRFVAVGESGVMMSVDGQKWVKVTNAGWLQNSYTDIVISDHEVNEYDTALFELSKVTTAINGANFKTLENTDALQASLDAVVANEINAVVNQTQKDLLMKTVQKNQDRLDSLDVAIVKYAEFQALFAKEAELVSPTLEQIEALRAEVSDFTATLTEIPDSSIRSQFTYTTGLVGSLLERLNVKEADIYVSRAEESLRQADYTVAYSYASDLVWGSTARNEMLARLANVLAGIPVREATVAVETAEASLTVADHNSASSKVNALPSSTEKTALQNRLQFVYLEIIRAELALATAEPTSTKLTNLSNLFPKVNSSLPEIVSEKAALLAEFDALEDDFYSEFISNTWEKVLTSGFQSNDYSTIHAAYFKLTAPKMAEYRDINTLVHNMYWSQTQVKAVELAEKNYTDENGATYLDAVAKIKTINASYPLLVAHLTERLEDLGTVKVKVANADANVTVTYEPLVEGASSYEVLRDGTVIYSGTETNFTDTEILGDKSYEYTVNVSDADGNVIGSKTKTITTPSFTNVTAVNTSGNVELNTTYQKDGDVTYEILRNNEVIYEGANSSFVDRTAEGASEHTYQVKVKDSAGAVIGTKEVLVNTAINNPTGTTSEETSETSTLIQWGEDKNPESTEYMVQATPSGDFEATPSTTVEDYESATPALPKVGNWSRSTLAKKTGSYGLKSATIGHRGTTTSTYTIDVPATVTDGKVSFDYRVSSEANYDWFRVVLNGTQIVRESGNGSWKTIQKNLKPGKNTLVFEYKKDGSASRYSDAAFIDNLTATTAKSGVETSGWIKEKEYEFTGLLDGVEYEFSLVAKANGLQSETVIVGANNPADDVREALESLVDGFENLDLTDLEKIADAQEQLDAVKELADALPDGIEKEELIAELNDIQEMLDNAKALAEAKQAVDSFIDALPEELATQEAIDEATAGLNEVQEMVEALVDSEEKEALVERLTEVETSIELAQDVLNATEAVFELMDAVATLETQEAIDEALALLEDAKDLVSLLPADNTARVELEKGLTEAQQTIELAQKVLNAKEAVTELKNAVGTLETQEAIDQSRAVLETAKELVALLPADHAVRVELEKEIAVAEKAIDVAQAVLDVAKLADAPTQAEIDKARESLEKVEAGDVKDALLEKIELAQAVLDAKNLLEEIATREIDTTEQVDQAIADLKSTDELIASLEGSFMDGEKPALEQAHSKAKKHIADEFLALLEDNKNQKGKKEKLSISDASLHLLVQQLVAENPEITKGDLKGQLQPLLASSVTGKALNDVIAVYVN